MPKPLSDGGKETYWLAHEASGVVKTGKVVMPKRRKITPQANDAVVTKGRRRDQTTRIASMQGPNATSDTASTGTTTMVEGHTQR